MKVMVSKGSLGAVLAEHGAEDISVYGGERIIQHIFYVRCPGCGARISLGGADDSRALTMLVSAIEAWPVHAGHPDPHPVRCSWRVPDDIRVMSKMLCGEGGLYASLRVFEVVEALGAALTYDEMHNLGAKLEIAWYSRRENGRDTDSIGQWSGEQASLKGERCTGIIVRGCKTAGTYATVDASIKCAPDELELVVQAMLVLGDELIVRVNEILAAHRVESARTSAILLTAAEVGGLTGDDDEQARGSGS